VRQSFFDFSDWELDLSCLTILNNQILGSGAFAVVCKGILKGQLPILRVHKNLQLALEWQDAATTEVAVKMAPTHCRATIKYDSFFCVGVIKNAAI
jgi:hypothetical protein